MIPHDQPTVEIAKVYRAVLNAKSSFESGQVILQEVHELTTYVIELERLRADLDTGLIEPNTLEQLNRVVKDITQTLWQLTATITNSLTCDVVDDLNDPDGL